MWSYVYKTIKNNAREDIRKHNLDEIRETIEASKSLKRGQKNTQPRKKPDDNTNKANISKNKIRSWNE